jgi:D-beta-D-heptose 7-phosphate kinase/D-beta-D-heptose 1-phosphate adenosyltransferase
VQRFADARILCIGDLMLDRYVVGQVDRISPEAPIPVVAISSISAMAGASGNVARNIAALGGEVSLIGVVGDDEEGRELVRLLSAEPAIVPNLVTAPGRVTTLKMRFVAAGQQLLRADREVSQPIPRVAEDQILAAYEDELVDATLVVVSDYAKGVLTDRVLEQVIARAKAAGKSVIVDPKSMSLSRYSGATVIKPNAKELARATGLPCRTEDEIEQAARWVFQGVDTQALLVTRDESGMMLIPRDRPPVSLGSRAGEVFDTSGAGDTTIATLALGLASGLSLEDAVALANEAAGIVVGKRGTAVVFPQDLTHALHATDLRDASIKIKDTAPAIDQVHQWRAAGLRVGFTNGVFDLVHPGHVALLAEARAQVDRLIVGLNTDASVKRLKGESRPVQDEMARAIVLASLQTADMVVLFGEDTPIRLIEAFRPDVLIKGQDYTAENVVGAEFVRSYGGRLHLAKILPDNSTTRTIAKLKS